MLLPHTAMNPLKKGTLFQKAHTYRLRYFSRKSSTSTSSAAAAFLSRFQSQGPQRRTQLLDANQLHLLSLTLGRPRRLPVIHAKSSTSSNLTFDEEFQSLPIPTNGTPLPPGYHLAYFTPAFLESELGADGTDTSYNPSAPFTRRMWAGGQVTWPGVAPNGKRNLLRIGQEVTETTRVLSAEPKVVRKTGEEMIVVGVEKTFENEDGVAVVDRRNWVFREALPLNVQKAQPQVSRASTPREKKSSPSPPSPSATGTDIYKRPFTQTPVTLFRFSALTFNPHKIHYSLPWARDVEGHKNVVVHGPLNLLLMLDLWRDVQHARHGEKRLHPDSSEGLILPTSIEYRATNPLYADEGYEVVLEEGEGGSGSVNIFNHEGVVCMKAEIKA